MSRAPGGFDAVMGNLGPELGRWALAVLVTGFSAAAAAHWVWNLGELGGSSVQQAEPIAVDVIVARKNSPPSAAEQPAPPMPAVEAELPREDPPGSTAPSTMDTPAEPAPAPPAPPSGMDDQPPQVEAVDPLPEVVPVPPSPTPAPASSPASQTPMTATDIVAPSPGIQLPMPRPRRPDEFESPFEAVALPKMPSADLQASRAATPATVHQRPTTQRPPPTTSPAAAAPATQSAATAPARQAPPQVSASAEQAWQGRVIAHLYRRRDYPAAAQRSRLQGTATLRFRIDAAGRVLSAQISRSSGHDVLDEAVMAMIARASPVPAPPEGLAAGKLTLVVPIEFALR